MSSTTSTARRLTTLRVIHLVSNTVVPLIVLILFLIYNICIYVYTFHYNQPVPKSAVIANVTLTLTFMFLARVGNIIVNFAGDPDSPSREDTDPESGRVEDVAERMWEKFESRLSDMMKQNHIPGPPWAPREDAGRHGASSPDSVQLPPRSNLTITNPDNDLTSPTEAEPHGLARSRAYTEHDMSSYPEMTSRHPVVPTKQYNPYIPPRPRTPSPSRCLDPETTHARPYGAQPGNCVPEKRNRSPYLEGYGDESEVDAPARPTYQQTNHMPKKQQSGSQYVSRGPKQFEDIVPPDQLGGHHKEENHDIRAYLATLPPQPLIDSPPTYQKESYPWRESHHHKGRLYDEAYQPSKYEEEFMRSLFRARGWREDELPPRVRRLLMARDDESDKHRRSGTRPIPFGKDEQYGDHDRYWDMSDKHYAFRSQYHSPPHSRSPFAPKRRQRDTLVRRSSGSSSYSDPSPRQRRVSTRSPVLRDFEAHRDGRTVKRIMEDARRQNLAAYRLQGSDRILKEYSKDDRYDQPMVAEISPRTSVPGVRDEIGDDKKAAMSETLVKSWMSF
jgi:hypothetical protein